MYSCCKNIVASASFLDEAVEAGAVTWCVCSNGWPASSFALTTNNAGDVVSFLYCYLLLTSTATSQRGVHLPPCSVMTTIAVGAVLHRRYPISGDTQLHAKFSIYCTLTITGNCCFLNTFPQHRIATTVNHRRRRKKKNFTSFGQPNKADHLCQLWQSSSNLFEHIACST